MDVSQFFFQGVWSTPPQNESKLNQAFRVSRNACCFLSLCFFFFYEIGMNNNLYIPVFCDKLKFGTNLTFYFRLVEMLY